jgi:hypothetical protein
MANLAGQKTFQQMQDQIAQTTQRTTAALALKPNTAGIQQFINDAYIAICSERDWWWMFNVGTFQTVALQQTPYVMPDNVMQVLYMTIPAIQRKIKFGSFSQWIVNYPGRYQSMQNSSPWAYIEAPEASNNALQFYLFPSADSNKGANYTIEYGYKQRITLLSAGSDIPIIPPEFAQCIVNRALEMIFRELNDSRWEIYYDNAEDKKNDASRRYDAMWLKNEQFNDYVAKFRNIEMENAFVSSTDINRALFVPF